jgi:integration host factor subunit beta
MIKSELIQSLHRENPARAIDEIEMVVSLFFNQIAEHLAVGGRVELRGFGVFSARFRKARTGRNPLTGAAVEVNIKYVPHFKPSKEMNRRLTVNAESLHNRSDCWGDISQLSTVGSEHDE